MKRLFLLILLSCILLHSCDNVYYTPLESINSKQGNAQEIDASVLKADATSSNIETPNGLNPLIVTAKIADYLQNDVGYPGTIDMDASYKDDLGFDDIDIMELVLFLEDEFDLSISASQIELIKTVRNSVDVCFTQLIPDVNVYGEAISTGEYGGWSGGWDGSWSGGWTSGWTGGDDNPNHGGGGGGGTSTPSATNYLAVAPIQSINLDDRLDCFSTIPNNSSTTYSITIHVHSARQGYPTYEYWGNDPGHAYITLEKINGSNVQRLSFGFYPKEDTWITPTKNAVASGIGEESSNLTRRSDIRLTKEVTSLEFTNAIDKASSSSTKPYDLNDYNCTDFAVEVFNASQSNSSQLIVPDSNIGFTTPAGLYKVLDDKRVGGDANVSDAGGKPPISTNCN